MMRSQACAITFGDPVMISDIHVEHTHRDIGNVVNLERNPALSSRVAIREPNAPSPIRPSLSCAISTLTALQRFVDQENVCQQRAEGGSRKVGAGPLPRLRDLDPRRGEHNSGVDELT
jgi:hypothetical protein